MLDAVKTKVKSLKSSSESAYEYEPSFRDGASEYPSDDDYSDGGGDAVSRRNSSYSGGDDVDAHLAKADKAMSDLQDMHSKQSSAWKKALKHRSGAIVYYSKDKHNAGPKKNGKGSFEAPVFKGEMEIKGFSPAQVFGVVGTRNLWDDWYKEGNLVENLSDTCSLTYMCMQGIAGSSTRDLSLVEKVAGSPTGTISFVATSVQTPKVPRVSGRVRASIQLNGWVLEPIDGGTRISYYLLVNVKTFVPALIHKKYLARRPTCIAKINDYLQKNGAPPMAGIDQEGGGSGAGGLVAGSGGSVRRRRRDSISSKRSGRSGASSGGGMSGLPAHVTVNEEGDNYAEVQKAIKLFRQLNETSGWKTAVDNKGGKIFMKKRDQGLATVKGESKVNGVTTEQVLGTILNEAARREWDPRFATRTVIAHDNGFDQVEFVETAKAMHPHLGPRHYVLIRGVEREEVTSDNGEILVVARSIKSPSGDADEPKNSVKGQLDLSGFLLTPTGDNSVKITHIAQADIDEDDVPAFVERILVGEYAKQPADLAEFIDDFGYAPAFIRWGAGPATLEANGEGDLKDGKLVFQIGGDGKGTMKDGKQKAWLQYSDKMFERGLDVKIEPADAATVAKVDGIDRTIEFVWSDKVKKGVTVTVSRAEENGADDVTVDGQYLDKTVQMERGSGAGAAGAGARSKKANNKREEGAASESRSDNSEETMVDKDGEQQNANKAKSNGKGIVAAAAGAAGAVGGGLGALTGKARSSGNPVAPASVNGSAGAEQQMKEKGQFPDDACLIITKDLYFTRSQCIVIGAVVAGAYLYGKFN